MNLYLKRDLVFFDIESTGLHIIRDRIIQLAMIKYKKSGSVEELMFLVNPGIPISSEALKIHGISEEDLINKPAFKDIAHKVYEFIQDADLAGYNSNRFDIPILIEEMARCNYDLKMDERKLIDVQRIFYRMEPRTLKAAYKFYCDKELEKAHDAMFDIRATVEVLTGMLDKYNGIDLVDEEGKLIQQPVKNDIQSLHDFTNDSKLIDVTQRLKYDDQGEIVFAFGKYQGKPVAKTLYEDRNYFHWIQEKEFSYQVKQLVKKLLKEYENKMKNSREN